MTVVAINLFVVYKKGENTLVKGDLAKVDKGSCVLGSVVLYPSKRGRLCVHGGMPPCLIGFDVYKVYELNRGCPIPRCDLLLLIVWSMVVIGVDEVGR